MKLSFAFLIFVLIVLGCQDKQQKETIQEKEIKSRIKNKDLKKILPELIKIRKLTFKDNPFHENSNKNSLYIRFLTTENYLYTHISTMDCNHTSLYSFVDMINSNPISIFVESKSFQVERYFDLDGLAEIPEKNLMICEDWYFIACKFRNYKGKLILEKISTFFDNSYEYDFYDNSDSDFLTKNGFLISEPQPPKSLE